MHSISDHVWACVVQVGRFGRFCFACNNRTCARHRKRARVPLLSPPQPIWLYINKTGRTHFQRTIALRTGLFRAANCTRPVRGRNESCVCRDGGAFCVFLKINSRAGLCLYCLTCTGSGRMWPISGLLIATDCLPDFLPVECMSRKMRTESVHCHATVSALRFLIAVVAELQTNPFVHNACALTASNAWLSWLGRPMQTKETATTSGMGERQC